MPQKQKEKIIADELFGVYSIHSIIEIFTRINERITLLISCSGEDFLYLHARFKELHSQLNQATGYATSLINRLENCTGTYAIDKLERSLGSIKESRNKLSSEIKRTLELYNEIEKAIDHLYIPVNNFNQNLGTLHMLSANLMLDNQALEYAETLRSSIDVINQSFPNLAVQLRQLKTDMENARVTLLTAESSPFRLVDNSIDNLLSICHFLRTKQELAAAMAPRIGEIVSKTTASASEIITNLQYQDIVRQKIEHIEQTHRNILEKLSAIDLNAPRTVQLVNKAKVYLQIRDVAKLQSVQLAYANNEYQQAIETITEKYLVMAEQIGGINQVCRQLCSSGNSIPYLNSDGEETLHTTVSSLHSEFGKAQHKYLETTGTITTALLDFTDDCDRLHHYIKNLCHSPALKHSTVAIDPSTIDSIQQVDSFLDNFQKAIARIDEQSKKSLIALLADKHGVNDSLLTGSIPWALPEMDIKAIEVGFMQLCHEDTGIPALFKLQGDIFLGQHDAMKPVHELKYYELFELEIQKIINDLSDLSEKLHIEKEIDKDSSEILESMKRNYTVKSEHMVHEKIAGSMEKGDIELFDAVPDRLSEETEVNDNLELF